MPTECLISSGIQSWSGKGNQQSLRDHCPDYMSVVDDPPIFGHGVSSWLIGLSPNSSDTPMSNDRNILS